MPIEVGFWRLDDANVTKVEYNAFEKEKRLEDILANDLSILDSKLLLIGRQVSTRYGKFIDLLAMDADGNLVVIELKKDKTPRDVVAQLLDYGSWVQSLKDDDIARIFISYLQKYTDDKIGLSLDEAFQRKFATPSMPGVMNESHELVIVAAELDDSTERIINYLAEYGIAINAVFFRFFRDNQNEYLSRAWLIDPEKAEDIVAEKREQLPWNGEFYTTFGHDDIQNWEDAVKYGFISAWGGYSYKRRLEQLEPGNRVWVYVPGRGYVGVGDVIGKVMPVDEFTINKQDGTTLPITQAEVKATRMFEGIGNEDEVLFLVPVKWLKTVPLEQGIKEKGFFSNQNVVAQPTSKSWPLTVDRLKKRFNISE
jgi:hypothetical protein